MGFYLCFYLEYMKGRKGKGRKKKGGEEGKKGFVSLYLCIWMERPVPLPMYMGVEWSVKRLVFLLRFLLTIYGDFVFPNLGRPPCRLACKPSCKLTLSGYGISYRRRRKGDRGALGLGGAVANPYRHLVFEIQNEWSIFELNGTALKF